LDMTRVLAGVSGSFLVIKTTSLTTCSHTVRKYWATWGKQIITQIRMELYMLTTYVEQRLSRLSILHGVTIRDPGDHQMHPIPTGSSVSFLAKAHTTSPYEYSNFSPWNGSDFYRSIATKSLSVYRSTTRLAFQFSTSSHDNAMSLLKTTYPVP
jgi:hypothetical protein